MTSYGNCSRYGGPDHATLTVTMATCTNLGRCDPIILLTCKRGNVWVFGISGRYSGRAGSPEVGTVSGFSCASLTGRNSGLTDQHSSLTGCGADNSTSAGRETTSGCRTTFGLAISGSGFPAELRPSRLCERKTMVLVYVTMGVSWSSQGAHAEIDSLAADWRSKLRSELGSILTPLL